MLDPALTCPGLLPGAVCPDPSVSVAVHRTRGRLRTCVQGDLDLATADHLRALLQPLVAEAPELLVVDLTGVRFVDVAGLRALLDVARSQGAGGRELVVAHPSAMLRRIVALLHLERDLPFGDADED